MPPLVIEVGGLAETVTVAAEAAADSVADRRALVHRRDRLGPEPADQQPQLHEPDRARARRRRQRQQSRRLGGGGSNNTLMDGVSTVDTGNNQPVLFLNLEAIAEVKVLTSGYQAEYGKASGIQITAVTKSGTNQFRGSLYDVRRDSDWNSNSWANIKNGNAEGGQQRGRLGLFDRRAGRQARRQQQAVLLLQPGMEAAHDGRQRSTASASRPRSSGPAISRRRATTTATSST